MMIFDIILPVEVRFIINKLDGHGHAAYAVGGCVRDSLLGHEPKDWDICTSARPDEVAGCFEGYHVIETGLRHGTVTVRVNHKSFEVTTFRVDGDYSDGRRPDSVAFVRDLTADLARRDFTINAIAYNTDLIDPFGGARDVQDRVIRCVGDAGQRLREDALRIMRALRFASVLGFAIEEATSHAMFQNAHLLRNIAAERIMDELNKLIIGKNVLPVLMDYRDILAVPIPEIRPAFDFDQCNSCHCYDVWRHTAAAVAAAPPDVITRLALLFHDLGKPQCPVKSEDGVGLFYGHASVSAGIAKGILRRLKYPNNVLNHVCSLVLHHDAGIAPTGESVKRWLNRMPEDHFRRLLDVRRADYYTHSDACRFGRHAELDEITPLLDEIIAQGQCFSLKDLAADGRDMMALGAHGQTVGKLLDALLNLVISEELPNDRDILVDKARELLEKD